MIIWRPKGVFSHRPSWRENNKIAESNSGLRRWAGQDGENTRILKINNGIIFLMFALKINKTSGISFRTRDYQKQISYFDSKKAVEKYFSF